MRQLRFVFIAFLTSVLVINAVFLRKTVAVLLCGIMSANSVSGYSFLGDYGKADAAAPSSSVTASAYSGVVQKDSQKVAVCVFGVCVNLPTTNIPKIITPETPNPPPAPTSTSSIPNATSDSQSTVAESSLNSTGEGLTQKNPVDSNWKVNGQNAFVITPNSRYVVNPPIGAAAQWIGPEQNSGVGLLPSGIYSYSYVFDGKNITSISGEFASDNETTDILLNGSSLKIHNDFGNSFKVLTPFTFHPIQGQLNTITFLVQNWGNYPNDLRPSPTGLYVRFQESVAKKACPQFETMLSEAKDIQKLADKLERDDKAYFDAVIDIIIRGYSSPYAVYMLDVSSEEIPKLFKDETQIRAVRSQLIEHIRTKARNRKKFADTGINGDFIPDAPVYSKENIELFCTVDSSKFTEDFWDSMWMAGYIDYPLYTEIENKFIKHKPHPISEILIDIGLIIFPVERILFPFAAKVASEEVLLTRLEVEVAKKLEAKELPKVTTEELFALPPRLNKITAGMEINPAKNAIFRGGNSFKLKPNDARIDKSTGLVKPGWGPSLNADPLEEVIVNKGGAYQIESIPDGLKIIQQGGKLKHFVISPKELMPEEEFQNLLNQVKVFQ